MILLRLLIISLPVNFGWEMLQMPAFEGLPDGRLATAGLCALAADGDALIVLALWRVWRFSDPVWFAPATFGRYTVIDPHVVEDREGDVELTVSTNVMSHRISSSP